MYTFKVNIQNKAYHLAKSTQNKFLNITYRSQLTLKVMKTISLPRHKNQKNLTKYWSQQITSIQINESRWDLKNETVNLYVSQINLGRNIWRVRINTKAERNITHYNVQWDHQFRSQCLGIYKSELKSTRSFLITSLKYLYSSKLRITSTLYETSIISQNCK